MFIHAEHHRDKQRWRTPRHRLALAGVFLLAFFSACVTEHEKPNRGMTVRPGSNGGTASAIADYANANHANTIARTTPNVDAPIPSGPVAKPANTAVVLASRVVVGVIPLGSILYDGQVLPLVSPDGNFVAVQEGDPPAWPALLALPDQRPPIGTRLVVYDIRQAPARRVELPELAQYQGLVLGRSTDAQGFLVESIREDGSRWIGRASWASGRVEWLATGNSVSAHGILTPAGELVYSRRDLGSLSGDLILRRSDGSESIRRDPAGSYDLALVADDGSHIVAFARTASGIDAEAIALSEENPGSQSHKLGATIARRRVVDSIDPGMVFQLVAGLQGPVPALGTSEAGTKRGSAIAFLHPPLKRMVLFDALNGIFLPLAPDSVSATRWSDGTQSGYFCTTPKDLVFAIEPSAASLQDQTMPRRSDARILATPLIPRATTNPDRGLIVIGPMKGDPFRLAISAIKVGVPEE